MKPSIYLAAQYHQKNDIAKHAKVLSDLNYTVTSTWMEEPDSPNVSLHDANHATLKKYAGRDLQEIEAADLLVFFSQDTDALTRRGGRHVEFGYALGLGLEIAVVGPKENIFHHLAGIVHFADFSDFLYQLQVGDFDVRRVL